MVLLLRQNPSEIGAKAEKNEFASETLRFSVEQHCLARYERHLPSPDDRPQCDVIQTSVEFDFAAEDFLYFRFL